MRFVLLMAAREMRASWQRLLFFFVCIAIGVGAIVALRSVIQSVRHTFAGEARSLIAADAIITSNQPLKPEVVAKIDERLAAAGAESMRSIELATMARPADRADGRARMVELRAVERGFPYYGQMKLADGATYDARAAARTSACWYVRSCWRNSTSPSATASRSDPSGSRFAA